MIKIIAILDNSIGVGGGFDQALNAIAQMQKLSKNRFNFIVFTTIAKNLELLNKLGIESKFVKISFIDRWLSRLSQNDLWRNIQKKLMCIGPLEKELIKNDCDIVYFLTPINLSAALQKTNFINTIWDVCHREAPEFPEVRNFYEFFNRERHYKHNIAAATVTLTDSTKLANMASNFYGVDKSRFIAMPFSPSPLLENQHANEEETVLEKYSLSKGYFFYPAQFWSHKNHIRILQALLILKEKYEWKPIIVFSGKDYGNLSHIEKFIENNNISSQVKILGFVPYQDMRGLYKNSTAIVIPTYFGPTNLPPLEAWTLECPLIYSTLMEEQAGDAALLVNPDSAIELAEAMWECTKPDIRDRLISAGRQRLIEIEQEKKKAENLLCEALDKFSLRRQCWE